MDASHTQMFDGRQTIYCTKKSHRNGQQALQNNNFLLCPVLDDSFTISNFFLASSTSNISTSVKNLYADIVDRIANKPHPTIKVKVESSQEDNICSNITQDPLILKICNKETMREPTQSPINFIKIKHVLNSVITQKQLKKEN